jgi:hypothetical protein
MAYRTRIFQMLPWLGGLNTNLDESMIPANQLTRADHIIFASRGSRKKRDGINLDWDDASNGSQAIIGGLDYWYGTTSRTQRHLALAADKAFYSYTSGGTRSTRSLDGGATAWGSAVTTCSMTVINSLAIIAVDGSGNVMRKWAGGTADIFNLGGTPPEASIVCEHQGRLVCNDKTNVDRFHWSPPGDPEKWNGEGDSGGFDIGLGDGDPNGITSIFSWKGDLYIAKRTKLYRLVGELETAQVITVSKGLGVIAHNSVCATEDDVYFVSERGIHSLIATQNFGDIESTFISADIQKTFDEDFDRTKMTKIFGAYLDRINSIAFAVTLEGDTSNNTLYLYNVPQKAWYRWPNISCTSMWVANDSDKKRFYLGTSTTRVSKTFNDTNYDVSAAGVNTAIPMRIDTGYIYVDQSPYTVKGYKKFGLVYRPESTHTIAVTVRVDNLVPTPDNGLSFSETTGSDLLGSTFVLGGSVLGYSVSMAPYTQSIDGWGRGVKISIQQTGIDQSAEIQGFIIEYEGGGPAQEVQTAG